MKHNPNRCDKCDKLVGKKNLIKVPFLYCDKNDKGHDDVSHLVGLPIGEGYRQYYVCNECNKRGY